MYKSFAIVAACGLFAIANGFPGFGTNIIGGEDVKQGEIPYQILVALALSENSSLAVCGGSLVEVNNTQVVLTAAKCLRNIPINIIRVVAGELDWTVTSGFEQVQKISAKIVHPSYNGSDELSGNDIAILVPEMKFNLNINISTIALPNRSQNTSGMCIVSGWGNNGDGEGDIPPANLQLQKMNISTVPYDECEKEYEMRGLELPSTVICAGGNGAPDACLWDNGDPLVPVNGTYLAGIASSFTCGQSLIPGAYTDVAQYIEWIEERVKQI